MVAESYNALLFRLVMLGLVATIVAMAIMTVIWLLIARRRREVRGFEVKRTTGETPVLLDKELDDLPHRRSD